MNLEESAIGIFGAMIEKASAEARMKLADDYVEVGSGMTPQAAEMAESMSRLLEYFTASIAEDVVGNRSLLKELLFGDGDQD